MDQTAEVDKVSSVKIEGKQTLEEAASGLGVSLKKDLEETGELSIDELLNRIYHWENEYGENLSYEDFNSLTLMSLVIGTVKSVYEKKVGKDYKPRDVLKQSVITQQDVVSVVLGNLDDDGKPDRGMMKVFSLTGEIFEEYMDPGKGKMKEYGIYTEAGYWQGIKGMVTTALMFNKIGWDVRLPNPDHDIDYEVDLLVRNPDTDSTYSVDVTSRMPHIIDRQGTLSPGFYVGRESTPNNFPEDLADLVEGVIRVNVPPLSHHSSEGFYEDRVTGYPSNEAVDKFESYLKG